MTEIKRYYDGTHCPKCGSIDYDVDFNDHEKSCYHLELVVSGTCNKCGCKWNTQLENGPGPIETNVYHFETIIEEEC